MRRFLLTLAIGLSLALPATASADPSDVYGPELTERPTLGTTTTGACSFANGRTTCNYAYTYVGSWGCHVEDGLAYEVWTMGDMYGYYVFAGNVISGEPFTSFTPLTWSQLEDVPRPGIRPHAHEIQVYGSGIHHGYEAPIGYYVVDHC